MLRHRRSVPTLFAMIVVFASSALGQTGIQLSPDHIVTLQKVKCGFVGAAWVPGSVIKTTGFFYPSSQQLSDVKKKIKNGKKLSSAAIFKLQNQLAKINNGLRKAKKVCGTIVPATPVPVTPVPITPVPVPTVAATPLPGATTTQWDVTATNQRNDLGGQYLYFCPRNVTDTFNSTYGTDTYTTDSPICVSALHMGLITRGNGGNVRFKIKGAQSFYIGSDKNGVSSNAYGAFNTSYSFLDLASGQELVSSGPPPINYTRNAAAFRQLVDQTFTFSCLPSGIAGSIYGTNIYTDDSSICTAAVHSGRITFQNGGVVTIQIKPGQSSYLGTTLHGVTSTAYGAWDGSYIFIP